MENRGAYTFGPYRQDGSARTLTRDGAPVAITPKAFDALLYLVSNAGRTVGRQEMIRVLWPDVAVEEGNLNYNISQIRKILGESKPGVPYIQTLPKQGYRFVAAVSVQPAGQLLASRAEAAAGAVERVPRPAPGHAKLPRGVWIAAAVMGAAVMALTAWSVLGRNTMRNVAAGLSDKPLVRLDVDLGSDVSLDPFAAISPDGTRLVYVSKGHLFTRRLDQDKSIPLTGPEEVLSPFFSPDGKWVAYFVAGKLMKVSVEGGGAVKLCDADSANMGGTGGGSWGDDGYIVAALAPSGGLWRTPAAGGEPRPVTKLDRERGEITHRWPEILPGGKAVMFTAHTKTVGGFDDAEIDVVNLRDGSRKTLLKGGMHPRYLPTGHLLFLRQGTLFAAPFDMNRLEVHGTPSPVLEGVAYTVINGDAFFDFSKNGTLIYEAQQDAPDRGAEVVVKWLEESGATKPLLMKPGRYSRPRVSPDGRRLAMRMTDSSGIGLWSYDSELDTMTRLTEGSGTPDSPVWTPDGRFIVFDDLQAGGMYWTRSDRWSKPQPLTRSRIVQQPYSFTPDGKRLAFMEAGSGGFDLWTVPIRNDGEGLQAGTPEPFLQTAFDERHDSFSPDGHWVAYSSNETGAFEIYVRAFPDKGMRWQVSNTGGVDPVWSPVKHELFYRTEEQEIMVVSYTVNEDSFRAAKPRRWSQQRPANVSGRLTGNFDLAPDGRRIAMLANPERGEQESPHHVIFLQNFFDEVLRKAQR